MGMLGLDQPLVTLGPLQKTRPAPIAQFMAERLSRDLVSYSISRRARAEIRHHAAEYPNIEIAGLLLGTVEQSFERFLVTVTECVPARHTLASSVSVTFTGRTWCDLEASRSGFAGLQTVGWYHSHPGW